MGLIPRISRLNLCYCCELSLEYQIVDGTLLWGELPANRKSPRDIGSVTRVLAPCVDQDQLPILQLVGVLRVVEHTGVGTTTNNAVVGWRPSPMLAKLMEYGVFQMILAATRAAFLHRPHMGLC